MCGVVTELLDATVEVLLLPAVSLRWLVLLFSRESDTLLKEESRSEPSVESASAFVGPVFSGLSILESYNTLLPLSELSDDSNFL